MGVPRAAQDAPVLEGVGYIPLRGRDGRARAWAIVDLADYADVVRFRWHLHSRGYVEHLTGGRKHREIVLMHRYLLGLRRGDPREGDHVDRDRLNNRRSNLRITTHAQNQQNRAASGDRGSTSRFRGVHWNATLGRWEAHAALNGVTRYLGLADTEEEAARLARDFRREHMPFSMN